MNYTQQQFLLSLAVATALTGLSYAVGLLAGWIEHVSLLEAFAVFTSYSCTWLCVKESRWNYPIGAISVAAYSWLFWQSGLLSSAALNAYLLPTLVYGWFRWGRDEDTRPVRHLGWDAWLFAYGSLTALTYFAMKELTVYLGGTLPTADAFILIGSILAQFMLDNKRIESWLVWMAVNVVAIWTYWNAELYLVSFQFVFFLGNAFYGYAQWRKSMLWGNAHD